MPKPFGFLTKLVGNNRLTQQRTPMIIGVLCLCACLILPLLTLANAWLVRDLGGWEHLATHKLNTYFFTSLSLVFLTLLLSSVWAILPAWWLTHTHMKYRSLLDILMIFPIALPPYIAAIIYGDLLDSAGPIQQWLHTHFGLAVGSIPPIRSLAGGALVISLTTYPYLYLLARSAFLQQSITEQTIARTLGCSPTAVFWRIALPLSRPALIAGLALIMMETFADYGVASLFGIPTLSVGVVRSWTGLNDPIAALRLASILFTCIAVVITIERLARGKASFQNTQNNFAPFALTQASHLQKTIIILWCSIPIILGFALPIIVLLSWVNIDSLTNTTSWNAAYNGIKLASTVACLSTIIGLIFAYTLRQQHLKPLKYLIKFASSGYAIPGAVLAISLLIPLTWLDHKLNALTQWVGIGTVGLIFTGSFAAIAYAGVCRFLAPALGTLEAGLQNITIQLDQTARTLGRSQFMVFFHVHWPLLKGSIFVSFLLVFVEMLKELPATLILRPFNFNTLSIHVFELAIDENTREAALPALFLILTGFIPIVILGRRLATSRLHQPKEKV